MSENEVLKIKEAAELLGVSTTAMYKGFGPPPLNGYGKRKRWHRDDLMEWIESCRNPILSAEAERTTSTTNTTDGATENHLVKEIVGEQRVKRQSGSRKSRRKSQSENRNDEAA